VAGWLAPTVTASTMITQFFWGRKVRCHNGGVEKSWADPSQSQLDNRSSPPTMLFMEISLAPEIEERLARIASEAGKAPNQVVQELVADYVSHDEWFRREAQKGLASLDSGKFVSHEEVGSQIERILKP
jgi:predicted transcriptional regulator